MLALAQISVKSYAQSGDPRAKTGGIRDAIAGLKDNFQIRLNRDLGSLRLLPELPDLKELPEWSFAIHLKFTLRQPYYSRDDSSLYLLENPIRKEKVFRLPYIAPTQWKGTLHSVMVRQLAAQWEGKDGHTVTEDDLKEFIRRRTRLFMLFGSEKDLFSEDQKNALRNDGAAGLESTTSSLLSAQQRDWLNNTIFELPSPLNDRSYTPGDFIEFQSNKWYETKKYGTRISAIFSQGSKATKLLEEAHNAASGVEKDGADHSGSQGKAPFYLSTVFGHEEEIKTSDLKDKRDSILNKLMIPAAKGSTSGLRSLIAASVADTRRPINEITLWDISSAVAAFYKALVAQCVLDQAWLGRRNWKWRILRIAVNGPDFYGEASRLPDVLIRRKLLHSVLDNAKRLLEEDFPLGNEVYRDEMGSAFIMPDLQGDDDTGSEIKNLIEGRIKCEFENSLLKGEILPQVIVSKPHEKGLMLADTLKEDVLLYRETDTVKGWWKTSTDICSVCGLRPQGPGNKAKERKVCTVCEERREDRSKEWAGDLKTTIWTDEVADSLVRLVAPVDQVC